MGSRARRERQFKDNLADLYEAGKAEIFYTGSMPAWVGTESYWRGHGFKVPAKEQAVGIHAIYSLLLLTPAYALRDVAEITGKKAEERPVNRLMANSRLKFQRRSVMCRTL